MACPACGQRKGKRACPALGQTICTVCCATKRLVEINCPADCAHLAAAREHPAAVVRRQQEQDVAALLPSIQHLTERQHQLFFVFHAAIARHQPDGFARLIDEDVAEAAATAAATLETAGRGVIYEHQAQSIVAQRLARELQALVAEMRERGAKIYDGEVAMTLRAIERGAREQRSPGASQTAYLDRMARLLQANRAAAAAQTADVPASKPSSAIILPS
jgi:hypothetical protein